MRVKSTKKISSKTTTKNTNQLELTFRENIKNKKEIIKWDEIKHIVISFINDFYSEGKEFVIDESLDEKNSNLDEIEQKIVKILDQKIRPAVARDGGDIKFKEFKDGIVTVNLQGSCSGCPSSTMTLKKGVQNLLCHYIPEIKEVIAI